MGVGGREARIKEREKKESKKNRDVVKDNPVQWKEHTGLGAEVLGSTPGCLTQCVWP